MPTSVTGPPAIPSSAVGATKRQRGSTNGCGRRGDLRVTAAPLADDVLSQLGVDDYLNRHYTAASATPVSVYVGYYASQRQGDTIHSPQNCINPSCPWKLRPVRPGS